EREQDVIDYAILASGDLLRIQGWPRTHYTRTWQQRVEASDVEAFSLGNWLVQTRDGVSSKLGDTIYQACLGGEFGASVESPCGSGKFVEPFYGLVELPEQWAHLVLDAHLVDFN